MPALIALLAWGIWRTVWRRDRAVGLPLYLGLVIIVDGFLNTGIFIAGLETGSIRFSELCGAFLLLNRPPASPRYSPYGTVRLFIGLYFLLLLFSTFRSDPMIPGIFEFRMRIIPQIIAFLIAMRGFYSLEDFRRFFGCLTALSLILGLFVFWDLFFDRWLISSDLLLKSDYGHGGVWNRAEVWTAAAGQPPQFLPADGGVRGFPALISFLVANGLVLFRAARFVMRGLSPGHTHIAFGLAVGIVGFLAVIYPDMHMFTQTVAPVYWVFVGLLLALTTTIRQPTEAGLRQPALAVEGL